MTDFHAPRPCSVPGCPRLRHAADFCQAHAARARRHGGDPGPAEIGVHHRAGERPPCAACGERPATVRGRCQRCYMRARRAR